MEVENAPFQNQKGHFRLPTTNSVFFHTDADHQIWAAEPAFRVVFCRLARWIQMGR